MSTTQRACILAVVIANVAPQLANAQVATVEPERYRAVVDLEVGDLDGPASLTEVEHVVVLDSRVYVSQPREQLIRVLSSDTGEVLGVVGRSGDGPGEFRGLGWIGAINGQLTAIDFRLNRITTMGPDGTVRGTEAFRSPSPDPPFVYAGWPHPTAKGGIIVFGDLLASVDAGPVEELPVVVASSRGEILNHLPGAALGNPTVVLRSERAVTVFPRPLHTGSRHAMSADGSRFVITRESESGELLLFVYDTREQTTDTLRTGLPSVEVPRTVSDSITERLRAVIDGEGPGAIPLGEMERSVRGQAMWVPSRVPAVDELFLADNGEIWLREPNFGSAADRWRIVTAGGAVRAEVEVPRGSVLRARDGQHLWGFRVDDEWGITSVQRFRLEAVN